MLEQEHRATDEIKSAKNKAGDGGREVAAAAVVWRGESRGGDLVRWVGVDGGGGGDVPAEEGWRCVMGWEFLGVWGGFWESGVDKARDWLPLSTRRLSYRIPRPDSLGCNPRPIPRR